MATDLVYPFINGKRYSFASITLGLSFIPFTLLGVTSIEYKNTKTPGKLRGTSPQVLGKTTGDLESSLSIEMGRLEYDVMIAALSDSGGSQGSRGYMDVVFPVIVSYAELNAPTVTDTIVGVNITEDAHTNAQGTDPTKVKLTLDPMYILMSGRPPIDGMKL